MSRSLSEIALEIEGDCGSKEWFYYAEAYVTPMKSLESINDMYYEDSAVLVVRYALSNLTYWRGDTARRVKAELNTLLKGRSN